jgi:biotin carboxylase
MPRILLLLPTATYRAPDFIEAADRLGVDVVVGSEHRQALARSMGDRAVVVPLTNLDAAVNAIVALHERNPLDAVLAVDDPGLEIAARASAVLGFRHNKSESVAATRDKTLMRERFARASLRQPEYRIVASDVDVVVAARDIGYPCVLKPVSRSASQGVMRVNNDEETVAGAARIRAILEGSHENLLVERFVPGVEVAVEGLLSQGKLHVLAVFDKPDPLDGPFFEETIYVTPSRLSPVVLGEIGDAAGRAASALGLTEGPVHVELRVGDEGVVTTLELAARSIGGLCARSLRFGAGVSLEELIVRHALGLGVEGLQRESQASGVMMLPIREAGVLDHVSGLNEARAVDGVVGVDITIAKGRAVVPLPEGDRYLGFIFARGASAENVEETLRRAESCLAVHLK